MSVVETAYRLDLDDESWLLAVAHAVGPLLDQGFGMLAWFYDARTEGTVETSRFVTVGRRQRARPEIAVAFASRMLGPSRWLELGRPLPRPVLRAAGQVIWVLNAVDPTGHCCALAAPVPSRRGGTGLVAEPMWARLAAHVAAGLRLRRRLASAADERAPEAIVTPAGRVEHASGPARRPAALLALRKAALAAARARGPLRASKPERALALWQGLVDGRWTLVDRFDRDGRRFLIAHRNDPRLGTPRALTPRERQVLAYAALGHATKLIAYELGLSVGAVSAYLATALRKLGLRSRLELATIGAPLGQPDRERESA